MHFNGPLPVSLCSDAQANGISNWDSHSDIKKTHAMQAEIFDQPAAALLQDLKQRGLLENTLVVWWRSQERGPPDLPPCNLGIQPEIATLKVWSQ